jgi:hypothetical protein
MSSTAPQFMNQVIPNIQSLVVGKLQEQYNICDALIKKNLKESGFFDFIDAVCTNRSVTEENQEKIATALTRYCSAIFHAKAGLKEQDHDEELAIQLGIDQKQVSHAASEKLNTDAIEGLKEQLQVEIRTALNDCFTPVMDFFKQQLEASNPEQIVAVLQAIETAKVQSPNNNCTEANEEILLAKDLATAKEQIANALNRNQNPIDALSNALTQFSAPVLAELQKHSRTIVSPLFLGGHGMHVAQNVSQELQPSLIQALKLLKTNPTSSSAEETLERRNKLAEELVKISKDLEESLKANPSLNKQQFFKNRIEDLNLSLSADDIVLITSHLENTQNIPQQEQKSQTVAFLEKHKNHLVMAIPVVLGPLAAMLSKLPLVGHFISNVTPFFMDIAKHAIPTMLLGGTLMNNRDSNKNESQEPMNNRVSDANESQEPNSTRRSTQISA